MMVERCDLSIPMFIISLAYKNSIKDRSQNLKSEAMNRIKAIEDSKIKLYSIAKGLMGKI